MSAQEVSIEAHGTRLEGDFEVPDAAHGLVVFTRRNAQVAAAMRAGGMGTLVLDLVTPELRFDVDRLATRLEVATEWVMSLPECRHLPIAFFGASTGAAAALITAAHLDDLVAAVVSCGGRPDLAGQYLPRVTAPTLLIVGERDTHVLELNREAYLHMRCTRSLIVVPRATHHFEEPGAMEQAAALASGWLRQHIPSAVPHWVEHGAGYPATDRRHAAR